MNEGLRTRRFTVEGDEATVREMADTFGWTITVPRWWERTYAIPRWLVWMVATSMTLNGLHAIAVWLGG